MLSHLNLMCMKSIVVAVGSVCSLISYDVTPGCTDDRKGPEAMGRERPSGWMDAMGFWKKVGGTDFRAILGPKRAKNGYFRAGIVKSVIVP